MKLSKKQILLVSFMLFSLFFGAGNLIFPPFLGENAASKMPIAICGFIITAVILPVLGVYVVAKFNGLEKLASKVNPKFAVVFTIVIYLAIGPGLGIPRAASLPFEMAIAPYLNDTEHLWIYMLIFSFVFFLVAFWLSLSPNKLINRIGKFLTPSLLILIVFVFISFLIKGEVKIGDPNDLYINNSFVQGFMDGYLTMDTIAALNFGLVISITLSNMQITEQKTKMHYILLCGTFAGLILTSVYIMLSYLGMAFSFNMENVSNGSVILRAVVNSLYGNFGAVVLALIFTLACLTTCVGLITSISEYFYKLQPKIKYNYYVIVIAVFSFIICNQGLNQLLEISVPVLDLIYPISICLIILGLFHSLYKNNKFIYPISIITVGFMSLLYVLDRFIDYGAFANVLEALPLYKNGLGWILFFIVSIFVSIVIDFFVKFIKRRRNQVENV